MNNQEVTPRKLSRKARRSTSFVKRVITTATIVATAVVMISIVGIAATHKQVKVVDAGKTVEVSTWARDTHSVLVEAGIDLGQHDVVIPARSTSVANGSAITVNRARPVSVIKDGGKVSRHWSAATSVVEVVKELTDITEEKAQVAVLRTDEEPLPVVHEKAEVAVIHDGTTTSVEVDAGAESDKVLQAAKVELSPLDKVRVGVNESGSPEITVVRVSRGVNVESTAVEHEVVEQNDDTMDKGKKETVTEGVNGLIETRSFTVIEDGEVIHQSPPEQVTVSEPVTKVVKVGTKKVVVATNDGEAAPGQAAPGVAVSGEAVWDALARCESGGNPRAVGGGGRYFGLYQFSPSTWRSVGGSGSPADASPEEQLSRAKQLQARSGWGQWPHCSRQIGAR